jgi:hypothetical protein
VTVPDYRPIYTRDLISLYAQRYAWSNMQDQVRVLRGLGGQQDIIYEGRGRVHMFASPIQMGFGDEPQFMVSGTISIPDNDYPAERPIRPQVDDHVLVLNHPDIIAIWRTYRVVHVDAGGQFESVVTMSCITSEESPTAHEPGMVT